MNEGMKKIFTLIIYQVSRQLWGEQTMVLLWIKNARFKLMKKHCTQICPQYIYWDSKTLTAV